MAIDLNAAFQQDGSRFLIFPQAPALHSIGEPEPVWLSRPAGSIGAGPIDDAMVVRHAMSKTDPYSADYLPPYAGPVHPPPTPDANGHFDHWPPGSREFEACHMYAVVRRVLDVWEYYLGEPLRWHFQELYERLELIPLIDWQNAQSGFGYIESGYASSTSGERSLHCLNFDVLAHEVGHSIIYSVVGTPWLHTETPEYFAFQEAAADITALVSTLHFCSVVDRLLEQTGGNLYALNELNRVGELAENEQIRVASNRWRMSDFVDGYEKEHHLSQPLTGALFDILVGMFHQLLVERSLIDTELAQAAVLLPLQQHAVSAGESELQAGFDHAYQMAPEQFRHALLDARDHFGRLLAACWVQLSAHHLSFVDVAHSLLDVELKHTGGHFQPLILDSFLWREIGEVAPGPKLGAASDDGAHSCR